MAQEVTAPAEPPSDSGTTAPDRPRRAKQPEPAPPPASAGDEAPVRRRGRPPIGPPDTVRLPADLRAFAVEAGGGTMPKGVRLALQALRELGGPLALSADDLAYAKKAGGGKVAEGLRRMLRSERDQVHASVAARLKSDRELAVTALAGSLGALAGIASELGDGDVALGIRRALRAAELLSVETVKRLADGPAISTS